MMLFYNRAPGIIGGDKAKALREVEAIARIDRAKGYMAQARLAQEQAQRPPLEDLYKKAIEANPDDYEAHIALGNIYLGSNVRRFADAESHARRALAIEPTRSSGHSVLAAAMAAGKRWDDLDRVLAAAERANADDLAPYYVAGSILLRDGTDLPRAERCFRKYLTQEREGGQASHAAAQWRRGLVLEKAGRRAEAISALETAVRLDPSFEAAKKDLKRMKG